MIALAAIGFACVPGAPPAAADNAGCTVVETRSAAFNQTPWSVVEERWDTAGNRVFYGRTLAPDDDDALFEEHSWSFVAGRLVKETQVAGDLLGDRPPVWLTWHDYDPDGQRIETSHAFEDGPDLGTWSWTYDPAGLPAGGTFDRDGDGIVDGTRVEVWVKHPFGWEIAIDEDVDSDQPIHIQREVDEEERELWRSEDWGLDGITEVIEQHTYDAAGHLIGWELSGAAMIDEGCTNTFVGDHKVRATCADGLHDGTFDWSWVHLDGRSHTATVTHTTAEFTEPWETVTYDWDCDAR